MVNIVKKQVGSEAKELNVNQKPCLCLYILVPICDCFTVCVTVAFMPKVRIIIIVPVLLPK